MKLFQAIYCLTLAGAVIASSVSADEQNRRTIVTFSEPVEIPGVHLSGWGVLPAGTYVFKLLDSQSDRHFVQILSEDETKVYATILSISDTRLKPTDKTVITFDERPADRPMALRGWFYPGSTSGEEFVYSKEKATELAKTNKVPVPYTSAAIPVEAADPIQSVEAPVVVAMKQAPVETAEPAAEVVPPATAVPASAPANLPSTASNGPLMALLGLLALSSAWLLGKTFKTGQR